MSVYRVDNGEYLHSVDVRRPFFSDVTIRDVLVAGDRIVVVTDEPRVVAMPLSL